jgi:hypothetical protein
MLAEGKICFRTCLKAVRIPASYIIKLASSPYPPTSPDKPQDFITAFYHWFFIETLAAVGGHSLI